MADRRWIEHPDGSVELNGGLHKGGLCKPEGDDPQPEDEIEEHLQDLFGETEEALHPGDPIPEEEGELILTAAEIRQRICATLIPQAVPPNFRMLVNGLTLNSFVSAVSAFLVESAGMMDGLCSSEPGDEGEERYRFFLEKMRESFKNLTGLDIKS